MSGSAQGSPEKLQIYGLVQGIGDAVVQNDIDRVEFFRIQLALIVELMPNSAVQAKPIDVALWRVFEVSGKWMRKVKGYTADKVSEAVKTAIPLINQSY